jgi:hypothetical protein
VLLLLVFGAISGCSPGKQKKLNKRVSLWRNDKIPYGTYYAYENLKYIFPEADVIIDKDFSGKAETDYWERINENKGKVAVFVIAPEIEPTDEQMGRLFNFINQGNQVFVSALRFSRKFLDSFSVKDDRSMLFGFSDTLTVNIHHPVTDDEDSLTYPGYAGNNYFTSIDSNYVRILGKNKNGSANFIRITYKSGGSLYLHLEPFVFTNFFLLHKQNKIYYDYALSFLPAHTKLITWSEYFRNPGKKNFSALRYILNNPSFAWAFWLLLLLFLIIYLFESKRKQRMIPAVVALRNSSLDFVKTIGRLYYQRKDNLNLANKMSAHFLAHVRTKYNLPTSLLDAEFAEKLSYKSGYDRKLAKDIVDDIKVTQQQQTLSDDGLLRLNEKIEAFYKHT